MPDAWLPPYLRLDAALAQFIAVHETQGQQHIKPLHQHIAIRLVIEAGFHPALPRRVAWVGRSAFRP